MFPIVSPVELTLPPVSPEALCSDPSSVEVRPHKRKNAESVDVTNELLAQLQREFGNCAVRKEFCVAENGNRADVVLEVDGAALLIECKVKNFAHAIGQLLCYAADLDESGRWPRWSAAGDAQKLMIVALASESPSDARRAAVLSAQFASSTLASKRVLVWHPGVSIRGLIASSAP